MHPRRAIALLVTNDLARWRQGAVRRHLKRCESCRAHYDRQVGLFRALAGDLERPTPQENERLLERVMASARLEGLVPSAEKGPPEAQEQGESVDGGLWRRLFDRLALFPEAAAVSGALLVVLGAFGGLALSGGFAEEPYFPEVGHLSRAHGLDVDGVAASEEGARLRAGQKVQTGTEGLAEIVLDSGGEVRVYSDTLLSFGGFGREVSLVQGRIWCLVDSSDGPFEVSTPNGTARVEGTSFIVEHEPEGATEVRVIEGQVLVSDADEQREVRVAGGRQTRVDPGQSPSSPVAYDSSRDESEWRRMWRAFLRGLRQATDGVREGLKDLFGPRR